ncbi:hypothetical protein QZH41_015183, partial [Actinostola sp. cb2023]
LEAVEARIQEANLGRRHRTDNNDNLGEPTARQVFSQNQRLGRVSRYELRPTINEWQYSRDMDISLRHRLVEFPSSRERTQNVHTSCFRNYNGSNYSDRHHSPPSRDIRTISPPYINDIDVMKSSVDDSLSLQRNVDSHRTREDTGAGVSNLGTSKFEDSLEVSSINRKELIGVRPLSPLVTISDNSEALARLKKRIKKQKERTPAPKQKENEDAVVNVIQPCSEDRQTTDNQELTTKPICKRKVVTAAPPTGYKGFSIPNTVTVPSKDKEGKTQSRNGYYPYTSKTGLKRSSKPQKTNQANDAKIQKGGVKMRRITAARPPMDYITPFSWRTGLETVKKVLGPSNTRPKSTASTRAHSAVSQETSTAASRMENGKWEENEREERVLSEEKLASEDRVLAGNTALLDGVLSEGMLSEDAKNVLSDLEMNSDNSDDEDEPVKQVKPKLDSFSENNVPKRKLSSEKEEHKAKKGKSKPKKKMSPKHKSPGTSPPTVQRHYDVDKVKKYMEKKMKDRKEKLREDKMLKQEAMDGRKKRLEELYNKQKKILTTNLSQYTTKYKMGETHSVNPGNFTFQQHSLGFNSEVKSTDVASFTGLPTLPQRNKNKPRSHDFNHHSVVSSEISVESLDEDHIVSSGRQEVHSVTLTSDESRYTRSRAVNGEIPKDEREMSKVYPGFPSELVPSPSRTERIQAIRSTAAALKHRLEQEAKRLGLSLLEKADTEQPLSTRGVTVREPDVFRGNLPGVSNLHEQAESFLNDKLIQMLPVRVTYLMLKLRIAMSLIEVYIHGIKRMSVINIYLRNLSNMRQNQVYIHIDYDLPSHITEERPHDPVAIDEENDTASLYSDNHMDKTSDTASLTHEDLREDYVDLDKTLVKESPPKASHEYESTEEDHDDYVKVDELVLLSATRGHENSPDTKQKLENEKVESEMRERGNEMSRSPSADRSYSISSYGIPSPSNTDTEYSPVRSTVKSTTPPSAIEDSTHPGQTTNRYPPSIYFPSRQGGDRMSPGSLDHRMMAELNRLEFMEESVRQLTDIERTKSVSLAQQETVSLAQILKAKQVSYAKEMEALQLKAKQEKMDAARQLDEVRHAAMTSSINAQESVAKVTAEAASAVANSTERLVKAQTEASRATTESAKRVEEARTEAARTLLEAANQQVADVRTVASSAASAAAQEAVRTTLGQFRQERRTLRKHDYTRSSLDSRSRSSYSRGSYTDERSPSYSRSRSSRIATEIESGASKEATGDGYTSDEFESFKESEMARSVRTASPDRPYSPENIDGSFIPDRERSGTKSSDSIQEEVDLSASEGSVVSDVIVKSITGATGSSDHKTKDNTDHDYSMIYEESMLSSRTVTDDEMDYRLILPSEGHRRRSIGKTQRSTSICSDAGTVSYSSDENPDKHLTESLHEKNTPFSGEESFSKFTSDMVKLMREEEVRAKHLEALLHLREKALKDNTKAEMEWLELQKKQMRDKGADDAMPFLKKRQRDVIKRLKAEKVSQLKLSLAWATCVLSPVLAAEIKYLMAANRAARFDRRLLMMNQEEITRLRRSTQKIRGKVRDEEAGVSRDKTTSEVLEDLSAHTRRSTPLMNDRPQDESKTTTVPEEISAIDSTTADTSFPTYDHESTISERVRKRSLSEGESDDGAPSGSAASKSKGSPTTSDSIVMQQLKKLKSQSSERYLTQREQKLMRRKHEGEDLLLSDRKLIEWERRLEEEEDKLNDVNRIKSQKSKRAIKAPQSRAREDDLSNMAPDRSRESLSPEVDSISKDISGASDHSDVETRIRELREQLQQREREVRRLHKEKKRQKRAMLHEEEESLRKKLQAVERILQKTKENRERPDTESKSEASATISPGVAQESIPDKSSSSEGAFEELRFSVTKDSIPDKSALGEGALKGLRPSESKESIPDRSSSSESLLKGLNVVLDLDFGSQDSEVDKESLPKSDVKDYRSGKQLNHTPRSYTEEIDDDAKTAEDISQASEIHTVSEGSDIEVPSRSARSNQERSRAKSGGSLPEILYMRSGRSGVESEDSVPEELSVKSSQRSGSESISEALSIRSSQRSGTESILEALSARSSKAQEISSRHSKSPVNDYSNTFESERNHDEDPTENDISEQIIEDEENRLPGKGATQKSYTSDFEVSESPKSNIGDIQERSFQTASQYSQDIESLLLTESIDCL